MNLRPDLSARIVRPGMEVEVRGQLVTRHDEVVVTGYGMLSGAEPELRWDETPFVHLGFTPDQQEKVSDDIGATVLGHGVWTGESVTDFTYTRDGSWTHEPYNERDYKVLKPVSEEVRCIEAPLFSSGAMLRRVRLEDALGPRVVVSATDVEAVEAALRPVYGDALEVHESRWSNSDLRGLDDVLNDLSDERVVKLKYLMDDDGVIARKLRLNYVDAPLAQALSTYPSDILLVEAIVEPPGVQRMPEPHLRPRVASVQQ